MKIKLSKSQWELIGNKTGWMKKALVNSNDPIIEPMDEEVEDINKNQKVDGNAVKDVQEKQVPNTLNTEQRQVLQPAEQAMRSKFQPMTPILADQKGKAVMYNLFDTLTNGNQQEINQNLGKMKPILEKFDKTDNPAKVR